MNPNFAKLLKSMVSIASTSLIYIINKKFDGPKNLKNDGGKIMQNNLIKQVLLAAVPLVVSKINQLIDRHTK